jgi:flagellar protein FliS
MLTAAALIQHSTRPPTFAAAQHRAALREYRAVDLEARVASASPHHLVLMRFDRLAFHIREARAAALAGDAPRRLRATEKALALVDGLDATLDDTRGGEVAQSLHSVYALVHSRLVEGAPAPLGEALAAIEELASAWRQIAPPASSQSGPERV